MPCAEKFPFACEKHSPKKSRSYAKKGRTPGKRPYPPGPGGPSRIKPRPRPSSYPQSPAQKYRQGRGRPPYP